MIESLGIYRHFKGTYYRLLYADVVHTETGEAHVVYQSLEDGAVYVRPQDVFLSPVDKEKHPDATQENRFEFVNYEEYVDIEELLFGSGAVRSKNTSDFEAIKQWNALDEFEKQILLNNSFCHNCGNTSFAPGYTFRSDKFGFVIEGHCSKCGDPIARCSY